MILIFLGLALTAAFGFLLFKLLKRNTRIQTKNLYESLALVQSLKDLMSFLQRHRGLTTRFLSGESRQNDSIERVQREVSDQVNKTEHISPKMGTDEAWLNLTRHWSKLSHQYRQLDVEQNITQHTALIRGVFALIDQVASSSHFKSGRSKHDLKLHTLWRELLIAAEHLGQVRAIGMSILSRGYASRSNRKKLLYVSTKVKESCEIAWINQSPNEKQKSLLIQIMQLVAKDLQEEYPKVESEYFFNLCSGLIDSLFGQYDELIEVYRTSQTH